MFQPCLEAVAEDAEGGARPAAACRVNLRRVLVGEVGNGGVEDGREGLQLVHKDEVAEGARREEEGVALFQRHCAAELGFVIVITCEKAGIMNGKSQGYPTLFFILWYRDRTYIVPSILYPIFRLFLRR